LKPSIETIGAELMNLTYKSDNWEAVSY